MAARSTSAGTPVKSWSTTRAGRKGTSRRAGLAGAQAASAATSSSVTVRPSTPRSSASRSTRMEKGSRESVPSPSRSRASSE